jgi:N utilization substance protein B
MLNRRILRVKAMQSIYAFKQAKKSHYYLALDFIQEAFLPDLNSMEVQNKELLEQEKQIALKAFQQSYLSQNITSETALSEKVRRVIHQAIEQYYKSVEKDKQYFAKRMVIEVEKIHDRYLSILQLLVALAHMAAQDRDKKTLVQQTKRAADYKLADNKAIALLKDFQPLQEAVIRKNLHWKNEEELLRSLYREMKEQEAYQQYAALPEADFEQDREIADFILKSLVLKKGEEKTIRTDKGEYESIEEILLMQAYFEEQDINWQENRDIVKSMLSKTLKSLDPAQPLQVELVELSLDWEADKEFFVDLYQESLRQEAPTTALIAQKAQNWQTERLAFVDRILLEMAVAEMTSFPSIPVKVSINEYIELSKRYSTPKSKLFVNGLLDAIAEELKAQGAIKKSGRGLIDNK